MSCFSKKYIRNIPERSVYLFIKYKFNSNIQFLLIGEYIPLINYIANKYFYEITMKCKNAVHAYKYDAQVYYYLILNESNDSNDNLGHCNHLSYIDSPSNCLNQGIGSKLLFWF